MGNVIGHGGGYWLGRLVGPGLRITWAGRKIGAHRWQAAEAVVRDTGGRALITTRFVAVVHAVVPAAVGILRLPFRCFLGLSAIGAVLWAGVQAAVAVALGEAVRAVGYGWTVLGVDMYGRRGGGRRRDPQRASAVRSTSCRAIRRRARSGCRSVCR
ncbi:DedA family protein [Saccharopolyspora sp. NPDC000995]